MMNYFDLSSGTRTLIMALLYIVTCLSTAVLYLVFKRTRLAPKILLPICTLVSITFVVFYATETRIVKFDRGMVAYVQKFCEMPIIICIMLMILCYFYVFFTLAQYINDGNRVLTKDAIKESVDKLPTGLCFYQENGRVILANDSINSLCHKIVGRDLQNAKLFWEILSGGEVLPEVERLESGDHPSFRLPDGRVWSFYRDVIKDAIQLVAADTTDLSNINAELKAKNVELASVNARLREYGDKVDELTRTRERVTIKASIHRELGQALLITRRFLVDGSGEHNAPISVWKKNIAMLTREADYVGEESPLELFMQAADAAGVEVKLDGKFPENQEYCHLFVAAAVECLVNGVRHAEAKTLYITIKEENGETSVLFENDGALPDREIVEGGGLSSIRYGAMRLGGKMDVRSKPKYSLLLTIPTEGVTSDVTI